MKLLFTITIALLFSTSLFAQGNKKYAIAINFYSECCGVPSSDPLFNAIKIFKKKNNIKKKIAYSNVGPLGKEGEYMLGFTLSELTKKQKTTFVAMVKKIVPTMKDQGSASVEENVTIEAPGGRATISKAVI